MEFAKTVRPNAPFSNIYHIRKYDKNNNLIDEYFGMNHFTNYGMQEYCIGKRSFPTNLYIGYGTNSPFDRDNKEIISPIMDNPATTINSTIDYGYPLYYYEDENHDTSKSYITCMCRFLQVRLDYEIPDREVRIAEYGVGDSQTALWTHSKVYNIAGNVTYITKKYGERLDFDVYMCMSYSEKLINDAWNNGVFTVITQMNRFMTPYSSSGSGDSLVEKYNMYPEKTFTYRRNNIITNRTNTKTRTYGTEDVGMNNARFVTTLRDFELYDQDSEDQRCFSGFCEYTPGWCVLQSAELSQAENVDTKIKVENLNNLYGYTVSELFGTKQECPFTKLHVDHVYMFNTVPDAITGQRGYTNEVDFINSDDHDYCETPMQPNCAVQISRQQNETNVQMYLHINANPTDPIIGFENLDIGTIYATDKYWDTWTFIPNPQHIPAEHQHDRFWITQTNDIPLKPIRGLNKFSYNPSCGTDETVGYSNMAKGGAYLFDGYDAFTDDSPDVQYRYCVNNNVVYYPALKTYYTIPYINSNTWNRHYGYGRWLLTFPNDASDSQNKYILTDVIGKQSAVITSSFVNLNADITDVAYITNNGNGIICLQTRNQSSISNRECIAIDLRNVPSIIQDMSQYEIYFGNTVCATAIWGTPYVAYILNGVHEIRIHDFDHPNTTDQAYAIPSDIQSSYKFIYAHSKYIWLTSGGSSGKTYVLNLDTGTWEFCGDRNCGLFGTDIDSSWNYIEFTCVDKFIMMYHSGNPTNWLRDVYYINIDNPIDVNLNMANYSSTESVDYFNSSKIFKLKYIETEYDNIGTMTKGTLALICNVGYYNRYSEGGQGACVKILDFGEFYYDEKLDNYSTSMVNDLFPIVPYGEFYIQGTRKIPIEYALRHKIVGTTTSVTAMNNIKHISDQRWETTITNVLSEAFDGVPRGEHR